MTEDMNIDPSLRSRLAKDAPGETPFDTNTDGNEPTAEELEAARKNLGFEKKDGNDSISEAA